MKEPNREQPKRLSIPAILAFSASSVPLGGLGIALAIFLQPYLASHLGVPLMVIAGAWFTVRMLDFGIDVTLGLLMDRFSSRFGRYRLWFIAGVPILLIAIYMLFMAPKGVAGAYIVSWLFVYYLGTSMLGLAHAAWSATLITQYHERSRVFGLMAPVGIVGALFVLAIPTIAQKLGHTSGESVQWMGWFAILLLPIAAAIVVASTPEHVAPEVKRPHAAIAWRDYWDLVRKPSFLRLLIGEAALVLGPGWMSALYLFFFVHSRGFTVPQASGLLSVYVLAGAIGAPAAAFVATKIGKHRTLFAATSAYSIGLMTVMLIPHGNFVLALPTMLWCGFMASGFGLMTRAMTADFGDEIRLEQGKERITLLYSFTSLAAKLASALAGFFTYSVLAAVGFDPKEGAINTAASVHGLELAYLIGPIVFVMLGGACFLGWNLDAGKHHRIRTELDARDAAYAQALSAETAYETVPLTPSALVD